MDQIEPPAQSSGKPATRPLTIKLAVIGMWVGALMTALNVLVAYVETIAANQTLYEDYGANEVLMDRLVHTGVWLAVGIAAALAFVEIVLWVTMALTNLHGFKWARIVATVLGILGFLISAGGLATSVIYDAVVAVSVIHAIVTQILSVAILVLLWRPGSSAYYQARTLDRAQRVTSEAASIR
ncbi:hypothetical protein [Nocardioides panzhihuensis]|uniref:DUF2127 domain-containing protein n=1 Tax=Nocardioides panzhihuensis TaxID=860243 RepID=A0A7Z0DSZ3_9ACTN|nr:hypothetical protein [Nocardioides panzhihuensis]NYI80799.1 hypothetical protein [Nocardioides panzhihuensis]